VVHGRFLPGRIVALAEQGRSPSPGPGLPLLSRKVPVGGKAAAYVCLRGTCLPPALTPGELTARLDAL